MINDLGFQYDTGVGGSLSDETRTISDGVVVDLVFEHNRHGGYNKITKVAAETSYHGNAKMMVLTRDAEGVPEMIQLLAYGTFQLRQQEASQ